MNDDVETAKAFLTMQRRWSWADLEALKGLVTRSRLTSGDLDEDQYFAMRQVWLAVRELLEAELQAAKAFGMHVSDAWLVASNMQGGTDDGRESLLRGSGLDARPTDDQGSDRPPVR